MFPRRLPMIVLLLAVVTSLVAACAAPVAPAPTAVPEEKPAEPEPTTRAEAAPGEVTEIDIMLRWGEGAGAQPKIAEKLAEFEADNPQYKVKPTWMGGGAYGKVRARLAAGDIPDLAFGNDAHVAIYAREGLSLPVDEYLEGMNYAGDAKWKDTFFPGLLKNAWIEDGGKGAHYYGIPVESHLTGIYYNVKMFEENGYALPETWSEMLDLCERVQSELEIPCFGADNITYYQARLTYYLIQRLLGQEILYNTATNRPGTSWKDEPGFLQAARMAQEFTTKYYVPGFQGNVQKTGQVEWANAGMAMIINATWLPAEVAGAKADDFVMDIFPFPSIEGGKGDPTVAEFKFNGWVIFEGAKHPEAAIHLLKFLTSPAVQQILIDVDKTPPAIRGIGVPDGVEGAAEMYEGYNSVRFGFGLDADAAEWQTNVFYPLNDELLFGNITPEQFIDDLQEAHDAFYAQKG